MNDNDFKRVNKYLKPRYMPGLDGFRAVAVIAIIIFHLNAQWLPGGFLGVDTFFVISGYLITALLVAEFYRDGTIDLFEFWKRRIKRLIPALLFLLGIVLLYTVIFESKIIFDIKKDIIAAFFYVSNWWYIFQNVDYFDQFQIAPLKHLWSLAIEEQFYLIYPIFLFLLLKFTNKKITFIILFFVSLVSLELMIFLNLSGHDTSRVYFGTDTRLQTLLLGALLAFMWPPFSLKKKISVKLKLLIDTIGIVGGLVLVCLLIVLNSEDKWLYNGGFYAISFMTLFVIASSVHPSGMFAKLIGNPFFVYLGKRSYSLYLWHYPVIVFVHKHFVAGQLPFYAYIIDIVLMLALTELSYHYIERPIRKKGFKAFSFMPAKFKKFGRLSLLVILIIPTILLYNGNFDSWAKSHEEKKQTSFNSPKKSSDSDKKASDDKKDDNQDKDNQKGSEDGQDKTEPKDLEPLLVGDSVMVDIGKVFQDKVPNATIDGKVGRQLTEANALATDKYQDYTNKDKDVVLELGTNGDFTKDQLEELIKNFNDANIYLVTVRVARDYQDHVNKEMHKAEKKHKNVHVIDWYKESEGHKDYFAYDGIHLEYEGSKALTDLITRRLVDEHNK
ncbi:acyltransferase family protein [Staphylococcus pettenkoferi]|uniref:acyltransferase family protein n=1 Tax=Staphylococcus pettenkoferi TaxID=170573 RepID=UPI00227428EF|nr:acyltransferase family protein [Staphylococcus pettenkoferi]MCY1574783.1 acetyltransferase [Staphylococcus pettenkoferi]MCY1578825.1 acetyltransferase [Staphylococcus pettenkoferi]